MKDKLSVLLDGELDGEQMRPVFDALKGDESLRADWEAYCLIGDALRGDRAGATGFVERVMAGLDAEPTVLAPKVRQAMPRSAWSASVLPLAASVMGVAAVGWVAHTLYGQQGGGEQLVAAASRTQVAEVDRSGVRPVSVAAGEDSHQKYVFVHQSMTGGGPISGAMLQVRTVSAVGQGENR